MMPFAIVQRLYQIPIGNGQVFLQCFPSPTFQELPQPWQKSGMQRQLGCSVCIVSKQSDLYVGMLFIFNLGKEQKTLPNAELSFISLVVLAWSNP